MLKFTFIIGLLIFSNQVLADEFPLETSSCFSGNFETKEIFIESVKRSRPGGTLKDGLEQRLSEDYDRWQTVERERVECRLFTYVVDDIPVKGFYIKPRGREEAELLPVIFNRGGNADGVIRTPYFYVKLAPLAEEGFLVVGSFYRGARVNGVESPHRLEDHFGGDDVNDVLQLLPIIDSIDGMENKKVGMWGVSRGGMMAFLAAKESDRFSTIVSDSAPVDLIAQAEDSDRMNPVFELWIPNFKENKEQALKARSVVYWLEELNRIPILLLHGADDRRVLPETILEFAQRLQSDKYPYQLTMYESAGHGLRGLEAEVNAQVASWLKKHSQIR